MGSLFCFSNMKTLIQKQHLAVSHNIAWHYFSTPRNLNEITPPDMRFSIKSALPDTMHEGLLIEYKIKLWNVVPLNWITEITHIKQQHYFVDEQRKGPFRIWHHEHWFQAAENNTVIMTDVLHYAIGKSIAGYLAGELFVHREVANIFRHRKLVLEKKFGVV